jgi:hypothetical protein
MSVQQPPDDIKKGHCFFQAQANLTCGTLVECTIMRIMRYSTVRQQKKDSAQFKDL